MTSERPTAELLSAQPHRRFDPLRDEWVLVSPGRTARPWSGQAEHPSIENAPSYDPSCYLCPGNERANGNRNPAYDSMFVFTNDFAALRPDVSTSDWNDRLLSAEGESGTCRVVCFSPRHDLSLAAMEPQDVRHVIDTWADQTRELGKSYRYVQVFENRGSAMGASNPHPHGQIWAGTALPVELARESATQRAYLDRTNHAMLTDYEAQERGSERQVLETDHWTVLVPFWAVWPFETMVLPRFAAASLPDVDGARRDDLARVMIGLLGAYDRLFAVPFPYSMGWHQQPTDSRPDSGWQLHAHYYPPLLRSATVRKFMVGYELLAEPQRDLTAEEAAERLRSFL